MESVDRDTSELKPLLDRLVRTFHEPVFDEAERNARLVGDDDEQVTGALLACVERQQEPELAHRLLSDAYRRRGDNAKASSHAAQAMAERRKHR